MVMMMVMVVVEYLYHDYGLMVMMNVRRRMIN
jgi:hypothetical protein